jgi:uncharacterized membrane protein YhiD involved in acid resistance
LIVFTYDKTTRDVDRSANFLQAIVLIAIVSATVMQAIGDSLARGLGMLGALAIIRFRTTLRNPRNMVFMFGSIAAGIACGVFGFVIAFTGTGAFCIIAFLLRYTPFSQKQNLIGTLVLRLPKDSDNFQLLELLLKKNCKAYKIKKYRVFTTRKKVERVEYEYQIRLLKELAGWELVNKLNELPEVRSVRLYFNDSEGIV